MQLFYTNQCWFFQAETAVPGNPSTLSAAPCCTGNPSPTRPWIRPQDRTWWITLPGDTPSSCLPGTEINTITAQCRLNFWGRSSMSAMRVKDPSRWCGSCGIPCRWRCLRRISGVGDGNRLVHHIPGRHQAVFQQGMCRFSRCARSGCRHAVIPARAQLFPDMHPGYCCGKSGEKTYFRPQV